MAGERQSFVLQKQWEACRDHSHHQFRLPYISLRSIEIDELHVIHLGTSQCLLGGVLWLLCYRILPESPDRNMNHVWPEKDVDTAARALQDCSEKQMLDHVAAQEPMTNQREMSREKVAAAANGEVRRLTVIMSILDKVPDRRLLARSCDRVIFMNQNYEN